MLDGIAFLRVGYSEHLDRSTSWWPHGFQACFALSVNLDTESSDVEIGGSPVRRSSHGNYVAEEGCALILELLAAMSIEATFFVSASDALEYPELVTRIVNAGHEAACHEVKYRSQSLFDTTASGELEAACSAVTHVVGTSPIGWRATRARLAANVLRRVAGMGFQYDASFVDSDLPYFIDLGERSLVEIPKHPLLDDRTLNCAGISDVHQEDLWKGELVPMIEDGLLYSLNVNPRSDVGTAWGSKLDKLYRLIELANAEGDIWFATHADIARWWSRKAAEGTLPLRKWTF